MQGVYCDRNSSLLFLVIIIMVVALPLSPQRLPIGHVSLWPDEKDFNRGFFWSLSCKESRLNCRHSSCLALLTLINHHVATWQQESWLVFFFSFFNNIKSPSLPNGITVGCLSAGPERALFTLSATKERHGALCAAAASTQVARWSGRDREQGIFPDTNEYQFY